MVALTMIDGYKLDHRRQYPDGTEYVYSNWTARGTRIPDIQEVVFVGLQYFLAKYLGEEFDKFFTSDIDKVAAAYERRVNGYLGPNTIGTEHIRDLHALGYLPLEFKALPEGTATPLRVPMLTVENTHPDFGWLVNYLETIMSATLWLPMTSATLAKRMRELLDSYAEKTGSPKEFVDWQGHDFSFRGMGGYEAAQMSGMGHLTQFTGTDTIPAIEFIEQYYGVPDDYLIGGSVAATEHSVMCAGGEDDEYETYKRILNLYPAGIVSVVSDTWDLWKVLTQTVPALHNEIMARDGKLVIRPDSGDPSDILCGTGTWEGHDFGESQTPAEKGVVELLWDEFGGTITETGHKLLDSHIGVIYGDAINYDRARDILQRLEAKGFASANVVFGMGSFGYQYQTRDTFGFAMKATNVVIDGVEKPIFKDPVTDNGTKKSLKGRVVVTDSANGLIVLDDEQAEMRDFVAYAKYADGTPRNLLTTVWKDGIFVKWYTFDEVRENARR